MSYSCLFIYTRPVTASACRTASFARAPPSPDASRPAAHRRSKGYRAARQKTLTMNRHRTHKGPRPPSSHHHPRSSGRAQSLFTSDSHLVIPANPFQSRFVEHALCSSTPELRRPVFSERQVIRISVYLGGSASDLLLLVRMLRCYVRYITILRRCSAVLQCILYP